MIRLRTGTVALAASILLTGCPSDERPQAADHFQLTEDAWAKRYERALKPPVDQESDAVAIYYTQVLLNRAVFSPGEIDAAWGHNTERAIRALQEREGLDETGSLDAATLRRLLRLAEAPPSPADLFASYRLTEDDLEGPFESIPDDIYEQAEMDRLGYESLGEQLGEMFHASPDLLRRLNPAADIDEMEVGDVVRVPAIRSAHPVGRGAVEHIVVSDAGRFLQALDADGRVIYHFPATLGDDYYPSPRETLEIESVTLDPWWHYQPDILRDVDDEDDDALIPPGPNNAVGSVWINLSREHYGIHGTSAPGSIGYSASSGCVRLTNWDALFLANRVRPGLEVEFVDIER